MNNYALFLPIFLVLFACSPGQESYNGFVTKLGNDTLAVESFYQDGNNYTVDVVVRSPKTVLTRYEGTLSEAGGLSSLNEYRFDPSSAFRGEGNLFRSFLPNGDSLTITTNLDDGTRISTFEYNGEFLPFIEYTHWPFDLALLKAARANSDTLAVPMLSGRRALDFIIADLGNDNKTVRHTFRGVMDVTVTDSEALKTLDAGQTTRKLFVERTSDADVEAAAAQFAKYEQDGKVFGALSGAVVDQFEVEGVIFDLSYGSPSKRGRDLFGGIVPYGERWRTGANRATHIKFDKDITIGGLMAPANEYTLFSIPEEDGGTLFINTQTGQNGRSYNADLDLGQVELKREVNPDMVEVFTITVTETDEGGRLN
jgi:hypothetical protein